MLRQAATQACKLKCMSFTCGLSAQFSFRRYCYEEDFCEEDFLVAAPHQCDGGTWQESDVPWSFLMKTTCPQRHKINMKNRKGTKRMNAIMTQEELEKSLESYRKFLNWMYSWFLNCWSYSGGNWLWLWRIWSAVCRPSARCVLLSASNSRKHVLLHKRAAYNSPALSQYQSEFRRNFNMSLKKNLIKSMTELGEMLNVIGTL